MDKLADILSTFFVTSQNYKPNKKDPANSIKKDKTSSKLSKSDKIAEHHHSIPSEHHSIHSDHHSILSEHHSIPLKHHSIPSEHHSIPLEHHSIPLEHHSIHSIPLEQHSSKNTLPDTSSSLSNSLDHSSSSESSRKSSKKSSSESSSESSKSSSESSKSSSESSIKDESRNNTKSKKSIEEITQEIRQDIKEKFNEESLVKNSDVDKEKVSEESLVKNVDDVMKKYVLKPSEFYKKNMFIISDNVKTSIDILSDFLHKISMMKNADSIYNNSINIISNVQNKKLYKQMLLENPYLYFTNFDVKNSLTKRKIDSLDNDLRTIFIFDNEMAHQYVEYIDILFSKNAHVFVLLDEEDKNIYDLYNHFESKLLIYKPSKNKMLQKRFYKNFIKKHFKDLLFDQYYNKVNNENIDIKYVVLKNDELRYN